MTMVQTKSAWDEDTGEVLNGSGYGSEGASQLAVEPMNMQGVVRAPDTGVLGLMVQSAQALVRDPAKLIARAKQIGGLLGASGFYRFPAGGSNVEGPSIDMAQALAQEWGAIVYQVRIVHAEPLASGGQRVHLRASVADMRTLVCAEVDQVVSTAPPPGKFAEKVDQRERWNGMQVQSAASKIVRNAILRVLPAWFVEPAFVEALSIANGRVLGGKSLPDARKEALDALGQKGAKPDELEVYLGQPVDMWAVAQIATLRELYRDLKDGKVSIEAWRAALTAKAEGGGSRKSALGLAPKTDGSDPLAAERAELDRVKRELEETKAKAAGDAKPNGEPKDGKAKPSQGELVK